MRLQQRTATQLLTNTQTSAMTSSYETAHLFAPVRQDYKVLYHGTLGGIARNDATVICDYDIV